MTTENTQMYAVLPVDFAPAQLISTTATETVAEYNAATTYAADAQVRLDATGRIYLSLQASNTGHPPATSDLWWVDIGPANRVAMFDNKLSTQTLGASPLVVEIAPGAVVSNLGLLRLVGSQVVVEMLVDASVVYTKTVSLQGATIGDWADYYFTPDEQITVALFDDLPLYYSAHLRITITGPGTVGCGHCVYGRRQDLGALHYGATAQLLDYSTKTTDDFGQTTFVERDYADEFSGQLDVPNDQVNSVKRALRSLRAKPTLYVGTPDSRFIELFVAFGWVRSHRVAVQYPNHSLIDIEIGALT